jgi:hypothetical protein
MRRGRAIETLKPVLIEKRGERRLSQRRFPENAEQGSRRLVLLTRQRRNNGGGLGGGAIARIRTGTESEIGKMPPRRRRQHEMSDLVQDHIGFGAAVEGLAVPIETAPRASRMHRDASRARQFEHGRVVLLCPAAGGTLGRARADPRKGGAGRGIGKPDGEAVERSIELIARNWGQHCPVPQQISKTDRRRTGTAYGTTLYSHFTRLPDFGSRVTASQISILMGDGVVVDDSFAVSEFDEPQESTAQFRNTYTELPPDSGVGIVFWLITTICAAAIVAVGLLGLPLYYLSNGDAARRPAAEPAHAGNASASRPAAAAPLPPPQSSRSTKSEAIATLPMPPLPKKPVAPAVAASPAPATAVPDVHASAPAPAPSVAKPATPPPGPPRLSQAQIAALSAHGDDLLGAGDIVSARLFYERAADAGDGRAALRLGATFDPNFLAHAGLHDVRGDAAQALRWYRRARELGAVDAEHWIKRLEPRTGRQ